MARQESNREDLMQEATGLFRRVEWTVPFAHDPVVAGFKKNGAFSVYFGAEPVYLTTILATITKHELVEAVMWCVRLEQEGKPDAIIADSSKPLSSGPSFLWVAHAPIIISPGARVVVWGKLMDAPIAARANGEVRATFHGRPCV